MRHPRGPSVLAMLNEQVPGNCAVCDEPLSLPIGKKFICGDDRCVAAYTLAWKADRRVEAKYEMAVMVGHASRRGTM